MDRVEDLIILGRCQRGIDNDADARGVVVAVAEINSAVLPDWRSTSKSTLRPPLSAGHLAVMGVIKLSPKAMNDKPFSLTSQLPDWNRLSFRPSSVSGRT